MTNCVETEKSLTNSWSSTDGCGSWKTLQSMMTRPFSLPHVSNSITTMVNSRTRESHVILGGVGRRAGHPRQRISPPRYSNNFLAYMTKGFCPRTRRSRGAHGTGGSPSHLTRTMETPTSSLGAVLESLRDVGYPSPQAKWRGSPSPHRGRGGHCQGCEDRHGRVIA